MSNGSGDFVIAFSTAESVRRRTGAAVPAPIQDLSNDYMSGLFRAVADATEEAIYNSMFKAITMQSKSAKVEALPIDRTVEILKRYRAIR
jgi:D-aminopeptidase